MIFIQTGEEGRVIAWTEADANPDADIWVESPWDEVPDDFDDWLWDGRCLMRSPRTDRPVPELSVDDILDAITELAGMAATLEDAVAEIGDILGGE